MTLNDDVRPTNHSDNFSLSSSQLMAREAYQPSLVHFHLRNEPSPQNKPEHLPNLVIAPYTLPFEGVPKSEQLVTDDPTRKYVPFESLNPEQKKELEYNIVTVKALAIEAAKDGTTSPEEAQRVVDEINRLGFQTLIPILTSDSWGPPISRIRGIFRGSVPYPSTEDDNVTVATKSDGTSAIWIKGYEVDDEIPIAIPIDELDKFSN